MRQAVRAIIIKDGNLPVMHRNKFGQEYDTLVGGGIDYRETPEQSLLREIKEETGLIVASPRLVFTEKAGDLFGDQLIYLCDYVSGEPALDPHSEEEQISKMGKNLYQPGWLPLDNLPSSKFVSPTLKQAILTGLKDGFPVAPQVLQKVYAGGTV